VFYEVEMSSCCNWVVRVRSWPPQIQGRVGWKALVKMLCCCARGVREKLARRCAFGVELRENLLRLRVRSAAHALAAIRSASVERAGGGSHGALPLERRRELPPRSRDAFLL